MIKYYYGRKMFWVMAFFWVSQLQKSITVEVQNQCKQFIYILSLVQNHFIVCTSTSNDKCVNLIMIYFA